MPYGSTSKQVSGIVERRKINNGNTYWSNSYSTHSFSEYSSRSGGKASSAALRAAKKLSGTVTSFVLATKQVPKGPRLAYKVFSKRHKRWVWARAPITVYYLKRVRKRLPRNYRGLDLPPNPLNYFSCKVTNENTDSSIVGVSVNDPKELRSNSGPLWEYFVPAGAIAPLMPNLSSLSSGGVSTRFQSYVDQCSASALALLYERAKNQKVNLGQALAERAQTASLLADTVVRLASAVALAKKGNIAAAAKKLFPGNSKELANDWLVFQYGVKPLISDIEGAAEHLAVGESLSFDIIAKISADVPPAVTTYPHRSYMYADTTLVSHGKVSVTYKVRVVASAALQRDLSRLGFLNVESLIWELLPYSFVVDWFLPIGDYLNSRDAFSGLSIVHGHKTVYQEEFLTVQRQFGGLDQTGFRWPSKVLFPWQCKKVSCVRTILTNLPPLGKPDLKDPVSKGHIANAMALLRQKFRR